MAITSVLGGQGRISDATLTAMLNSGDSDLIKRANEYIEGAKKEAEERGTNRGILGVISDLFGFSKLAAAEPNQQKFSQQFSVTQPSQFSFKPEPIIPDNVMAGSLLQDVVDTPTREFGQIRGGPESGDFGVRGLPQVQDLPVDFSELDDLEAQDAEAQQLIEQAQQEERRGALDILRSFGKDVAGRAILSNVLQGAGTMIGGPVVGAAAGIAGLMGGGNLFGGGKGMAPDLQKSLYSQYGSDSIGRLTDGIMAGYNPRAGNLLLTAVKRRQNVLRNMKKPGTTFRGLNYDPLTDFINQQVKEQTEYYGGTGATDVTGSSDYTSTGSPQSMGSTFGGAGGRPY